MQHKKHFTGIPPFGSKIVKYFQFDGTEKNIDLIKSEIPAIQFIQRDFEPNHDYTYLFTIQDEVFYVWKGEYIVLYDDGTVDAKNMVSSNEDDY